MASDETALAVIQSEVAAVKGMVRDLNEAMRPMVLERQDTLSRLARAELGLRDTASGLEAVKTKQVYHMGFAAGIGAIIPTLMSWFVRHFGSP